MKNVFLTVLFFSTLSLYSCEKSNEERAKDAIKKYLNENLDDMSTYELVKFGPLDTLFKLDVSGTSYASADKKYLYRYQMFHSYRLKDEKGLKHLTQSYFELNDKFEVIIITDYMNKNWEKIKYLGIPTEKEVDDFLHLGVKDSVMIDTSTIR